MVRSSNRRTDTSITSGSLYHGRGKDAPNPVDPELGHYAMYFATSAALLDLRRRPPSRDAVAPRFNSRPSRRASAESIADAPSLYRSAFVRCRYGSQPNVTRNAPI